MSIFLEKSKNRISLLFLLFEGPLVITVFVKTDNMQEGKRDSSPHFSLSLSLNSHENNIKTGIKHRAMPTLSPRWRWVNQGEQSTCNAGRRRIFSMFIQWLHLEEEVIYHLGNVAASVRVLDPPLCREPGTEEEESHPDGVLGCGLVLQLCTGTQLCPQRQKYVHSQGQCD